MKNNYDIKNNLNTYLLIHMERIDKNDIKNN